MTEKQLTQPAAVEEVLLDNRLNLSASRWRWVILVLGVTFSAFHIYTAVFGSLLAHQQRLIHLALAMMMGFLLYPAFNRDKQRPAFYDIFCALLTAAILVYAFYDHRALSFRHGMPNQWDIIVGIALTALVLELTRRIVGWALTIIAAIFLVYALVGPWMPSVFGHPGISLRRLADYLFLSTDGIFGLPIGVSATYIAIFVIFGAFLEVSKQGQFFIKLALAMVGRSSGGPAKAAVVSSALLGTISGSSIANVVVSGTFTIPLMIRNGYRRVFAGAVEAAASTGGQIMPPVMGSAAFLMVEYTGIAYVNIMAAATIPALLYFVGIYFSVHLEAKRIGATALSADETPDIWKLLAARWYQLIPPLVLIYFLMMGNTPMRAGFFAIVAAILMTYPRRHERLRLRGIINALELGATNMVPVAVACAAAGIIAGVIALTGVGLKLASLVAMVSQGQLWIALIITMIACLILGMGLPTVATYIVLVTIVAPTLQDMGVPVLAAHLFVFYFGVVADITPPIALAAFSASSISKANAFKTGIAATAIALAGFLIPYAFIYSPSLILVGMEATPGWWAELALRVGICLAGLWMLAAAFIGYSSVKLPLYWRILLAFGGLTAVTPHYVLDFVGMAVLVGALVWTRFELRRSNRPVPVPEAPDV